MLKKEIRALETRLQMLKNSAMSKHCGKAHKNRLICEMTGIENLIKLKQISYSRLQQN